jgi:phage major head subunit gpT-like protein
MKLKLTLRCIGSLAKLTAAASSVAFEGSAYNGGIMYPSCDGLPPGTPVVLDLDTLTIPDTVRPVLDDHDATTDGVIGETKMLAVRKSDYTLPVNGVLYPDKPRTKNLMAAKDHRWQLSVGVEQYTLEKIAAGRSVNVNGRTFQGPLVVARNAYLTDLSFVAVGGDDSTWARIAAARARRLRAAHTGVNPMTFDQWLANTFAMDAKTLTPEQTTKFQAMFDMEMAEPAADQAIEAATGKPAASVTQPAAQSAAQPAAQPIVQPAPVVAASRTTVKDNAMMFKMEARRIAQIERITAGHDDIYNKAVDGDWTPEQTRDAVELKTLRAGRAKPGAVASGTTKDIDAALQSDTLQASLLLSSGMPEVRVAKLFAKRGNAERILNDAMDEDHRGMSFQRLFDRCIRAAGETPHSNREGRTFLESARNSNRQLKAAGFTTMTISYILENFAQKTLLDGWDSMQAKWKEFCVMRSNVDFKPHSRYALDFTGQFRKVTPKGELQHVSLSDARYTSTLDTFGAVVTLDRQTYINDDLGAFTQRLSELGMLGAQSVEEAAFTLLLASIGSFFSAGNGNYISGASSALSVDSLATARKSFGNMVGPNSKPINVEMTKLLVGTVLQTAADVIYRSESIQLASSTVKTPTRNAFYNMFNPIASPYLNNTAIKAQDDAGNLSAISGQSDTLWFGFGQQGNRSAMSVAFLNGAQSPTVQSQPAPEIEILGEQYRAFIDYGVATEDYRLGFCSAGV